MTTKTIEKKLHNLNQQVTMLRSVVINIIGERDPEGQYRPEFVDKILKLAHGPQGGIQFRNTNDFLKLIV